MSDDESLPSPPSPPVQKHGGGDTFSICQYFGPVWMIVALVMLGAHSETTFEGILQHAHDSRSCEPNVYAVVEGTREDIIRISRSIQHSAEPCYRIHWYLSEGYEREKEGVELWASLKVFPLSALGGGGQWRWGDVVAHSFESAEVVVLLQNSSFVMGRPTRLSRVLSVLGGYASVQVNKSHCDTTVQVFRRGAEHTNKMLSYFAKGDHPIGEVLPAGDAVSCIPLSHLGWFSLAYIKGTRAARVLGKEFLKYINNTEPVLNVSAVLRDLDIRQPVKKKRRRKKSTTILFVSALPTGSPRETLSLCKAMRQTSLSKECFLQHISKAFVDGIAALGVSYHIALSIAVYAASQNERRAWEDLAAEYQLRHKRTVIFSFLPRVLDGHPTAWRYNYAAEAYMSQYGAVDGVCVLHIAAKGVASPLWETVPLSLKESSAVTLKDPLELSVCVSGEHVGRFGKVLPDLPYITAVRLLHEVYRLDHAQVDLFAILRANTSHVHAINTIKSFQDTKHLNTPVLYYPVGSDAALGASPDMWGATTTPRITRIGENTYSFQMKRMQELLV